MHPMDAQRVRLSNGEVADVRSRTGVEKVAIKVLPDLMQGTVALPHGWGHGDPGTKMRVAAEHAGVNSNLLTDHEAFDPLSGTSVLNGIPVEVVPAI